MANISVNLVSYCACERGDVHVNVRLSVHSGFSEGCITGWGSWRVQGVGSLVELIVFSFSCDIVSVLTAVLGNGPMRVSVLVFRGGWLMYCVNKANV
jgi:hypothetical protein